MEDADIMDRLSRALETQVRDDVVATVLLDLKYLFVRIHINAKLASFRICKPAAGMPVSHEHLLIVSLPTCMTIFF